MDCGNVGCPILILQVQYEYETTEHTRQHVYERTLESPYTFSIPAQVRGQLVLLYFCKVHIYEGLSLTYLLVQAVFLEKEVFLVE